jgi:putative hydrolase of the HAD superfamily
VGEETVIRELRAVFLDAGNTLLALDYEVIADCIRAAGHRDVTADRVRLAEHRARPRLDRHLGKASTETADTFRLYVGYMLEGLGLPAAGASPELADALRAAKPPYGLFSIRMPEAIAVLDRLRGRGLRLAVVSNSNGMVAEILRSVDLADAVDTIIDSGLVGVEKPNPKIFVKAAAAVGVRPEEAVHVGDLYSIDVVGARAAGLHAVLMDPGRCWPPRDCPTAPTVLDAVRHLLTI